jgi:hypothetical protein
MFIPTASYEPGFPAEWEGLDLESAKDAVPHWYGVSSGNGNDGVSHMWPDYYVRTCDPYALASCAMLSTFTEGEGQAWALKEIHVDGEAYYTISATVYDPPPDGSEPDIEALQQAYDEADEDDAEAVREAYEALQEAEANAESSWSEFNGAWLIVEVFRVDDMDSERSSAMQHDSLADAFTPELIALAMED